MGCTNQAASRFDFLLGIASVVRAVSAGAGGKSRRRSEPPASGRSKHAPVGESRQANGCPYARTQVSSRRDRDAKAVDEPQCARRDLRGDQATSSQRARIRVPHQIRSRRARAHRIGERPGEGGLRPETEFCPEADWRGCCGWDRGTPSLCDPCSCRGGRAEPPAPYACLPGPRPPSYRVGGGCLIFISLAFSRTSSSSRRKKPATSANDIPCSSADFKNNRSDCNHGVPMFAPNPHGHAPLLGQMSGHQN
jgi:hypothetical protein